MKTHERLRQARLQAGYRTGAEFARANNIFEGTYRAHESGTRGLTRHTALTYAKLLNISVDWLLSEVTDTSSNLSEKNNTPFSISLSQTPLPLNDQHLHRKAYPIAKEVLEKDDFELINEFAWKMVGIAKHYGESSLNKKLAEWLLTLEIQEA